MFNENGTDCVSPLAMIVQRIDLVAEILRHFDHEHAPLAAHLEKRGLSLIGIARLDLVVGADGNRQRFLGIAVVVADQQAEAAVVVAGTSLRRRG